MDGVVSSHYYFELWSELEPGVDMGEAGNFWEAWTRLSALSLGPNLQSKWEARAQGESCSNFTRRPMTLSLFRLIFLYCVPVWTLDNQSMQAAGASNCAARNV